MSAIEWIGVALLIAILVGALLYNPVVCAICDGPMARIGPTKLQCLDCGRIGNG